MDNKKYILLLCLFSLQGVLLNIDGGGNNFHVLRNPFYSSQSQGLVFVEIIEPVDGESYYTLESATINITVNTTGEWCRYRINSGEWNDLDLDGDMITFPEGDVTLRVECQSGTAIGSDSVTFYVEYLLGIFGGTFNGLILLGFIVVMCIWIMFDDENKKFYKQRI